MDNGDVLDPHSRANVNQVTADRSYSEVTGGLIQLHRMFLYLLLCPTMIML